MVGIFYRYAGVMFGITNTAATVPGMVAPLLAGYLTPNVSDPKTPYLMLEKLLTLSLSLSYFARL